MDSELAVNQMKGEYACRNRRLECPKRSADAIVARLCGSEVSVKFVHCKREHNTRAGALATLAMAPGLDGPMPDGLLQTVPPARPHLHPLATPDGDSDDDSDDSNDNSSPPFPAEECVEKQCNVAATTLG